LKKLYCFRDSCLFTKANRNWFYARPQTVLTCCFLAT